jgi:hypothetical protein
VLTAPDPTQGMVSLTVLDPILPILDPMEGMALLTIPGPMLTVLDSIEGMALLTALDQTAGPVEVGYLLVSGSTEDDLDLCVNYHVGTAGWSRGTATSSETSKLPTSRTTPNLKEKSSGPAMTRSPPDDNDCCALTSASNGSSPNRNLLSRIPSNGSRNQGRPPALGSAEERHLNLCPMASYYVPVMAGPLAKDKS